MRSQSDRALHGGLIEGGLARPDDLLEPLIEREPFGRSSKQRLTEVHVRLDESGEDPAIAPVEDARLGPIGGRIGGNDRGDPSRLDENRPRIPGVSGIVRVGAEQSAGVDAKSFAFSS